MNRLTRITSILIQLQSKRIVTAKEVADNYEISLRTVYRDIKTLQEAGVPIGSEAGIGYFIVDGYYMPPVSFTESEANALATAEKFVIRNSEGSLIQAYSSALLKIKAALRGGQKDKVELLQERIAPSTGEEVSSKSNYLSSIQEAITSYGILDIQYHSIYKNELTNREIEPLGLYFKQSNWVLIAYCLLRKSNREFRLDHIKKLKRIGQTSERSKEFSLEDYFKSIRQKYS